MIPALSIDGGWSSAFQRAVHDYPELAGVTVEIYRQFSDQSTHVRFGCRALAFSDTVLVVERDAIQDAVLDLAYVAGAGIRAFAAASAVDACRDGETV